MSQAKLRPVVAKIAPAPVDRFAAYTARLHDLANRIEVHDQVEGLVPFDGALTDIHLRLQVIRASDAGKVLFIGNGGSAAIASHCAVDFAKNGGTRALSLNDPAVLTCLSNDLGYEHVFAKQIEIHGQPHDLLFAISSSGASPNILNAVEAARGRGMEIVTLSGFAPDNPLRQSGDVNFYVPSGLYGLVEVVHLTILHGILDIFLESKETGEGDGRS